MNRSLVGGASNGVGQRAHGEPFTLGGHVRIKRHEACKGERGLTIQSKILREKKKEHQRTERAPSNSYPVNT